MKSDVYLRSQLQDIIVGLATTVEWLPTLTPSDDAELFHAGFVAALHAVAASVSIDLSAIQSPRRQAVHSTAVAPTCHVLIE